MTLGRNAKQLRHTMRNLVASLIENESVTTTAAKAKIAQGWVENLITKAKNAKSPSEISRAKVLVGADIYKQNETLPKIFDELVPRYGKRRGGYTRILKLEPRIGDNAPQVILELVDSSKREMKFWYIARVVARLELQGLELDSLTQKNVRSLLIHRENGEEVFRDAVKLCKERFYQDDESLLSNLPRIEGTKSGFHREFLNYDVVPRPRKTNKKTESSETK
ncbi:hypothetical protein B5S33_g2724 [[Candida] boidinii]|nr:hypothetical protein B5S30_g2813 [[Candida] boidinii]OWB84087.1 hypothetical protein B5S33_g2724 [[Candida] boidinii]